MYNSRKILGICDLHESPNIGGFSSKRSFGTTTFLGRYAIMDFTLSNFANSNIDGVCILVDKFYHSVIAHVDSGKQWTSNTKVGFEYLMFNEDLVYKPALNNDVNNIRINKAIFDKLDFNFVVIAPVHYLSSMDFRPIIEQHIESKAKITAVYVPIHDGKNTFTKSTVLSFNKDGTVKKFRKNPKTKDDIDVSLDTFVISRDTFDYIVERQGEISELYTLKEMISWLNDHEELHVHAYKFEHYVLPIMSMNDYLNGSYELLTYDNRRRIFRSDWPISTTTHDTPPTKYGENADVKESIVSNGCVIDGKVKHSILSRKVVVEKGASVSDCIIFTNTVIKKGVKLAYVNVDKNCVITKSMRGTPEDPIFIKGGSKF